MKDVATKLHIIDRLAQGAFGTAAPLAVGSELDPAEQVLVVVVVVVVAVVVVVVVSSD